LCKNLFIAHNVKVGKKILKEQQIPLTNASCYWSLFFLVVVPYIKTKLEDLYRDLVPVYNISIVSDEEIFAQTIDTSDQNFRTKLKVVLKNFFIQVYPVINAVFEGLMFLYQIFYLYERSKYFTPFLHLQNLRLRRLSTQEMQAQDKTRRETRKKKIN